MPYKSLREFIDLLEKHNELIRIKEFVNTDLEITEITDRVCKSKDNNKALLFENNGTAFPLLINAFGSEKRMCMALGINHFSDIAYEINTLFKKITAPHKNLLDKLSLLPELKKFADWMPAKQKGKGSCQEVIMQNPDLSLLPILKCWEKDGGKYITLPMVNTKDPITQVRNVGMYRMQIFSKNETGMHWQKHKVGARHFEAYKKLHKKMPVAVCLGGDPIYTYVATAPLPDQIDEYILAGFLRKKKVSLVSCITQPEIEVPEDVDFVIEGYVDTEESLVEEGPFGDHTGYYSLADYYPKFHVTAITHRKNAIYPTTIVGIPPQEDAYLGRATEAIFLEPIRLSVSPELQSMHMPVEGVFHNLVLSNIEKSYAGQAIKVMNALWGAGQMMFTKVHMISNVDTMMNLTNYLKMAQHCFKHFNPAKDILITRGPMDVLDHSSRKMGFGGKIGFDFTEKFEEEFDQEYIFQNPIIDKENILKNNPQIVAINDSLLQQNIPCIIVAMQKNTAHDIKNIQKNLIEENLIQSIKIILFVDASITINDLSAVIWMILNNIDAERDIYVYEKNIGNGKTANIAIDGCTKNKKIDGFDRDWPNIVITDDETIDKIDALWNKLGIGNFEPSPSLRFKNNFLGNDAIAIKNQ